MRIENKEVSWKVLDIDIQGTITGPVDEGPHSGVVVVAGSGPTDRDWCSPLLPGQNGSAKLIAEELANKGCVTLRYDKMASGPRVKENLPKFYGKVSMQTHADELAGAVTAIAAEKNVVDNEIFALTNSEGAIHAVNYQLRSPSIPFKGMILTGPPGLSVGEVARNQLIAQGRSIPNAAEIIRKYDGSISQFLAGESMVIDGSLPDGIQKLLTALQTPANLPFSRELWKYSLPHYISKINDAILVVIGKKDLQINWSVDGKMLEEALRDHEDSTFSYPEDANHVLKHEPLSPDRLTMEYALTHYNAPGTELDGETIAQITSWLEKHR